MTDVGNVERLLHPRRYGYQGNEIGPFILLVCGGRDFGAPVPPTDPLYAERYAEAVLLYQILDSIRPYVSVVVSGMAPGADTHAAQWAGSRGIPVAEFPADWDTHGKAAGPIRNKQMLVEGCPERLIAFAGGKGTENMVQQALNAGVPCYIACPGGMILERIT